MRKRASSHDKKGLRSWAQTNLPNDRGSHLRLRRLQTKAAWALFERSWAGCWWWSEILRDGCNKTPFSTSRIKPLSSRYGVAKVPINRRFPVFSTWSILRQVIAGLIGLFFGKMFDKSSRKQTQKHWDANRKSWYLSLYPSISEVNAPYYINWSAEISLFCQFFSA